MPESGHLRSTGEIAATPLRRVRGDVAASDDAGIEEATRRAQLSAG